MRDARRWDCSQPGKPLGLRWLAQILPDQLEHVIAEGHSSGRGAPNPDQLARYIAAGGFWQAHVPPEAGYFKPWNAAYQDWAVAMGFFDTPQPYLFQLYAEPLGRFQAAALGKCTLVGGRDVVERYQRGEPQGCYLVEPQNRAATSFFSLMLEPRDRFKGRFGERASGVLRRIVHVVSQERPVHVQFTVHFDDRNLPTP